MPTSEDAETPGYKIPITLECFKVDAPETYWLKRLYGMVYLEHNKVTRFTGLPKKYSFIDLCAAVQNSIDPDYARYCVEIKLSDKEFHNLVDPSYTEKIDFSSIAISGSDTDMVLLDKPVYTHVYNQRNKCLEPNIVFELTRTTAIAHTHLTQTEYNALLEL